MNHIHAYTGVRIEPKTLELLEKSLQCLEEIEDELNEMKETYKDLFDLWDASNTAYSSLWDFLSDYKDYRQEVSES